MFAPFRWLIPDGWGTTLWLLGSALVLAYLLHSAEMPAVKIETVALVLVNVVPFAVLIYLVYGEGWGLPGPYGMSISVMTMLVILWVTAFASLVTTRFLPAVLIVLYVPIALYLFVTEPASWVANGSALVQGRPLVSYVNEAHLAGVVAALVGLGVSTPYLFGPE